MKDLLLQASEVLDGVDANLVEANWLEDNVYRQLAQSLSQIATQPMALVREVETDTLSFYYGDDCDDKLYDIALMHGPYNGEEAELMHPDDLVSEFFDLNDRFELVYYGEVQ